MCKSDIDEQKLKIISNCSVHIGGEGSFVEVSRKLLLEVMHFYAAGRIYVFEFDWEKKIGINIEELCAEGIVPQKDNLQSVPMSAMNVWLEYFRTKSYMHIANVDALGDDREVERRILQEQGIKELLAVPLYYDGEICGLLGVDDPTANNTDAEFLSIMGSIVCGEMMRRRIERQREAAYAEVEEVFNSSVCGMAKFILDGDMPLVYANDAYYRIRDCHTEEEKNSCKNGTRKFIYPDDMEYVASQIKKVITERPSSLTIEYRILTAQSRIKWLRRNFTFLYDDVGYTLCTGTDIDITEEKKNEERVNIERKKLNIALRLIHGFYMWEYDVVKDVIYGGENYLDASICRHKKVKDAVKTITQSGQICAEDLPEVYRMHDDIKRGAPYSECEFRMAGTNPVRWRRVRYTVQLDENGKPISAIGSAKDITEEKKAAERYDEQLRYRDIVEKRTIGSYVINLTQDKASDGRSRYESLLKLNTDGTYKTLINNIYALSEMDGYSVKKKAALQADKLLEKFENGIAHYEFEHRFSLNGELRWLRTTTELFKNPHTGDIEGLIYAVDIDEEMLSRGVLQAIASQTYDFITVYDSVTLRMHVITKAPDFNNPVLDKTFVTEIWDGCLATLNDASDYDRLAAEFTAENIKERLDEFIVYNIDTTMRRANGELHHTRHTFTYLDKDKGVVCYSATNITDIYVKECQRRESMQEIIDEAERASRAKNEFMSKMSHEIRTPLNAIVGYTSISKKTISSLISSVGANPALGGVYGNLVKTESASQHLMSLINEVLDMSAIESGNTKITADEFSLKEFLFNLGSMYISQASAKGVNFEIVAAPLPETVVGDKLHLGQILMNILSNSMKFTPPGGNVTLDVSQEAVRGDNVYLRFRIIDTGIGMKAEFMKRMYHPFEQQDAIIAQRYGGTGLGLSITKNLVTLMKGSISAESEEGKGTSFTVEIPFARSKSEKPVADSAAYIADYSAILMGKRVLLAEDNQMNREIAEVILSGAGITVETAGNGKEALFKFTNMPRGYYDFILMDIIMPEMDGYEATRAIRASAHPDAKSIPILAMSANAFTEDVTKSLEAGMNNHIAKPIDTDSMFRIIAQSLSK